MARRPDVRGLLRSQPMPVAAVVAALVSCVLVPPDAAYGAYVEWGTLGKLASMLLAVGGLRASGAFQAAAAWVVGRCGGARSLLCALVGATALASMLVTNDMALLALLPLSAACLLAAGRRDLLAPTFVLQGIAANLCGMLLPFGNPQNIYLAGAYGIDMPAFVATMAVPFALATLLVALCCLAAGRGAVERQAPREPVSARQAALSGAALACCVAAVLGVLPVAACVAATLALALLADRALPARTDWGLVVTFAAFFVFAGNVARVEPVRDLFASWLAGGAFLPAALLSQLISNVPAAVVLAHFTGDWAGLLAGVNAGGAGTPIASLATLIVVGQYGALARRLPGVAPMPRFMVLLLVANAGFLAALLAAGVLLGW